MPTLKGSHRNAGVRPFQGRIVSSSFPGAALTHVRSAPGYYLYPLRGFQSMLLPLTFPARGGEAEPAREERAAADGRDCSEPAHAGEREDVEAAPEDERARDKEPARGVRERARPARRGPRGRDEREGVIHLIAHARLEHREHVRAQTLLQTVRPERARGDAHERRQCPQQKECSLHPLTPCRRRLNASAHAVFNISRAWRRAASVISAPVSMRAISSTRRRWSRRATPTSVRPRRPCLSTSRCVSAKRAICA